MVKVMNIPRITAIVLALAAVLTSAKVQAQMGPPIRDGEHRFSRKVDNYQDLKRRNIVMQKRDYSCGAAALATVAKYYWGDNVDEEFFLAILDHLLTLEEATERVKNGLAMADLRKAAVEAGYTAVVGRVSFQKLTESKVPLVVGITVDGYDHFVVYRGTDGIYVYLADPIRGNLRIPCREFVRQWQKQAILAIAKPGVKVKEHSRLSVTANELFLGQLNEQVVREAALAPITQPPYPTTGPR
jgi:uncharacterized protein